jgi:hypothetical protein
MPYQEPDEQTAEYVSRIIQTGIGDYNRKHAEIREVILQAMSRTLTTSLGDSTDAIIAAIRDAGYRIVAE